MVISVYPLILKDDYEGIRKNVLPELPETYEGWLDYLKRKIAEENLQYITPAAGGSFDAPKKQVNGGNFQTYCERKRVKPSLRWLFQFVNDPEALK